VDKDKRVLIAETMKNLQEAVFSSDLALMFQYEQELCYLVGEEFSMGFLNDLTQANKGKGNIVIDVYLSKVFDQGGENSAKVR
jgi:hypothetical protein